MLLLVRARQVREKLSSMLARCTVAQVANSWSMICRSGLCVSCPLPPLHRGWPMSTLFSRSEDQSQAEPRTLLAPQPTFLTPSPRLHSLSSPSPPSHLFLTPLPCTSLLPYLPEPWKPMSRHPWKGLDGKLAMRCPHHLSTLSWSPRRRAHAKECRKLSAPCVSYLA